MSGELGFALQIVGTVVGGVYGDAIGAYVGGLLGTVAANALGLVPGQQGPRLDDLRVRASTYGRPIPLVYGPENRVGGNVIWSTGLQESSHEEGGDLLSPGVEVFTYSASFAVAFGAGPMKNLKAVYGNGKLLWSRDDAITRLNAYEERRQRGQNQCTVWNIQQCLVLNQNAAFFASYDPAAVLPDLTPWILAPRVDAATSGGDGDYQGRSAIPWRYGEFSSLEWFPGTMDQPVSTIIPAPTPAYRGTAYLVFGGLQLARFGNAIPTIEVVVDGSPQDTVAEILEDFCARAGADLTEVVPRGALVNYPVRGYAIGQARTVMDAVTPLMQVYPFDACDQAGTLRFKPRTQSPVCTIPMQDMGARPPNERRKDLFPLERIPNVEMPQEASVTYADPENGYQPGTQVATRASGNAATKLSQSLPFTLSATEARAVAERMLWEGWLSREQVKGVRLSADKYDFLQCGDVFAVGLPGGYAAFRIVGIERGDNQVLDLTVVLEDRQAYAGDFPGGESYVFEQAPPYYDLTEPYFFNAPAITSAEDDTGFHLATDSPGPTWTRATIYRSIDGGVTFAQAGSRVVRDQIANVMGTLGSGPTAIWDRLNTLTVELVNPDGVLSSATEDEVLASHTKNLIWVGDEDGGSGELIQFASATLISTDGRRYALTNLLRGRRATEHAVAAHGANEKAVAIGDSGVGTLDFGQSDWNLLRIYMALSANEQLEDEAAPFGFIGTGERLKPRAPVHGAGERDGSNNLTISWVRRSRLFPPPMGYGAVPLGEASEAYEVDVMSGPTVLRTITATTPTASYLASEQVADGITPGNAVTVNIYQLSATYGRGHAGTFTI